MPEKTAIQQQLAESGPIVDQRIDMVTTAKKAFIGDGRRSCGIL